MSPSIVKPNSTPAKTTDAAPGEGVNRQISFKALEGGENKMKIMQKIMIAVALLGSFALATPAQAYEYEGCHRYHHYHYGCYHPYHCHYQYYEFYHCRPHCHYYHCW